MDSSKRSAGLKEAKKIKAVLKTAAQEQLPGPSHAAAPVPASDTTAAPRMSSRVISPFEVLAAIESVTPPDVAPSGDYNTPQIYFHELECMEVWFYIYFYI